MLSLKSRQDGWKLLFPKDFLADEIYAKYSKVLLDKKGFFTNPIDFLNETIQSVQVLGFQGATIQQQQSARGTNIMSGKFMHTSGDYNYRSEVNPIHLIDKTLNITFRHTVGFINYFMIFENFFHLYARGINANKQLDSLYIDIPNERGEIYCRIQLMDPVIDTMDMLDLNYTQPVAQSQTFQVQFKFSNIDFQFISLSDEPYDDNLDK